jgi:hypothetical protein
LNYRKESAECLVVRYWGQAKTTSTPLLISRILKRKRDQNQNQVNRSFISNGLPNKRDDRTDLKRFKTETKPIPNILKMEDKSGQTEKMSVMDLPIVINCGKIHIEVRSVESDFTVTHSFYSRFGFPKEFRSNLKDETWIGRRDATTESLFDREEWKAPSDFVWTNIRTIRLGLR